MFCGWFAGDLNFELDPLVTLNNLIRKWPSREPIYTAYPYNCVGMSPIDLLDINHFQLANGHAIFNAHSDPEWLLVAAGCTKDGIAIVVQGSIHDFAVQYLSAHVWR